MNYQAISAWQKLDLFGRKIDTFCGAPLPLSLKEIDVVCNDFPDPIGLKWRILLLEEKIFARRIKKFNSDAARRNKGKK